MRFGRLLTADRERTWLLLALGLLVATGHLLLPNQTLYIADHTAIFHRVLYQAATAYRELRWPLWDTSVGLGEPLAAYPAAMAWSPSISWLLIFGPSSNVGYNLIVVSFVAVAAVGTYLCARSLGASPLAAGHGAAIYALAGPTISFNCLLPAHQSLATAPLALWGALQLLDHPSLKRTLAFALFIVLHVQTTDPALIACDLIIWPVACASRFKNVRRAMPALISGFGLALLLGAISFLPLVDVLSGSQRGAGFSYDQLSQLSLPWPRLFELFFHGFGGDTINAVPLWFSGDPAGGRVYLGSIYLGAALLPLTLTSLRSGGGRKWVLIFAFFILLSLGWQTPLHRAFVSVIPGLSHSRYPIKYLSGATFALAMAVAHFVDATQAMSEQKSRRASLLIALLVIAATTATASLYGVAWLSPWLRPEISAEMAGEYVSGATAQSFIVAVCASALLLAAAANQERRGWLMFGHFALVLADLAISARSVLPTTTEKLFEPPAIATSVLRDEAKPTILVETRSGGLPSDFEMTFISASRLNRQRLFPGFGVLFGLKYVFDPDLNETRSRGWALLRDRFQSFGEDPRRFRLVSRLGVSHVVTQQMLAGTPGLLHVGSAEIALAPSVHAYRLQGHSPRVFAADTVIVADGLERSLDIMTSTSVSTGTLVVGVDNTVALEHQEILRRMHAGKGLRSEPRTLKEAPGEVEAIFVVDRPSIAVLAEMNVPGWKLEIDGKEAPVLAVDGALIGGLIPEGEHRVRFHYRPRAFTAGLYLSAVGYLLCVLLLLRSRVRRSGQRFPGTSS